MKAAVGDPRAAEPLKELDRPHSRSWHTQPSQAGSFGNEAGALLRRSPKVTPCIQTFDIAVTSDDEDLLTVFELSSPAKAGDPWAETALYRFQGGSDGPARVRLSWRIGRGIFMAARQQAALTGKGRSSN